MGSSESSGPQSETFVLNGGGAGGERGSEVRMEEKDREKTERETGEKETMRRRSSIEKKEWKKEIK